MNTRIILLAATQLVFSYPAFADDGTSASSTCQSTGACQAAPPACAAPTNSTTVTVPMVSVGPGTWTTSATAVGPTGKTTSSDLTDLPDVNLDDCTAAGASPSPPPPPAISPDAQSIIEQYKDKMSSTMMVNPNAGADYVARKVQQAVQQYTNSQAGKGTDPATVNQQTQQIMNTLQSYGNGLLNK